MSGQCLESVWAVSGQCLESVWRVSGQYLGIWILLVSGYSPERSARLLFVSGYPDTLQIVSSPGGVSLSGMRVVHACLMLMQVGLPERSKPTQQQDSVGSAGGAGTAPRNDDLVKVNNTWGSCCAACG